MRAYGHKYDVTINCCGGYCRFNNIRHVSAAYDLVVSEEVKGSHQRAVWRDAEGCGTMPPD